MKNQSVVLLLSVILAVTGCMRQKDLPVPERSIAEKPNLSTRYPSTPDEIALVQNLAKITEVFKVLYRNNDNVKLVNAAIYAGVFADECVLLGDLIFPAQSRLSDYPRFISLSNTWQVDLQQFANNFWSEVSKRSDVQFDQFLQTLTPRVLSGNQLTTDDGGVPPVSVYFPYSERFSPSPGANYFPTVALTTAIADTDEAPGSEPVFLNGVLTGYSDVLINDQYASSRPSHIIGVNGPDEPATGPGGGGGFSAGGFGFGVGCAPCTGSGIALQVPTEVKRAVLIDHYVLKSQYDNLISFSGNGGGSEIRLNRISAHLQPTGSGTVSSFAPLLAPSNSSSSYSFDQTLTTHTRQEISDKVWKRTAYFNASHGESRWDTSWAPNNYEQALAVWEYDNTSQRTTFSGQLHTSLVSTGSYPMTIVPGLKSYSVQVPSHHAPIKHLRIDRATYFGEARNDFGFGFRTQNCSAAFSTMTSYWESCHNWSDFAGLSPTRFSIPSTLDQVTRWPARDVHWDSKAGADFGWVWPYRVYYLNGGFPTNYF